MTNKDKLKLVKHMIIISWVCLVFVMLLKVLFGVNFNVVVSNETFVSVCNFIDDNNLVKTLLYLVSSFLTLSMFSLAILQKFKFTKSQLLMIIISCLIGSIGKAYLGVVFGIVYDIWQTFVIHFILDKQINFRKIKIVLFANVLNFAFQLISTTISNLSFTAMYESVLVGMIMCIDLYIMMFLYYLYANLLKLKGGE
jgi:hypothetical protein